MKYIASTILMLLILTTSSMAQVDKYGTIDTVSIQSVDAIPGESLEVNVLLYNDEPLSGITIPLKYPLDKLQIDTILFESGRIENADWKPLNINRSRGTVVVGALIVSGDLIPPGNGMICRLLFTVRDSVQTGESLTIDTTTVSPAELLLTSAEATDIIPAFKSGAINIVESNGAPLFTPISEQYVAEGDTLTINLHVSDPDGDPLVISNPVHPLGSSFTDFGNGTAQFIWVPDFVGPNSSDVSPFEFTFRASDGTLTVSSKAVVNVFNTNRPPQVYCSVPSPAEAGDTITLNVSVVDPDYEGVTWNISGLPAGAQFNYQNPGKIYWETAFADSGNYQINLSAADIHGLADTAIINLKVLPVSFFTLSIPDTVVHPSDIFDFDISLKNRSAIDGFNLLLHFDPAVVTPMGVTLEGTRAAGFNNFVYRTNENGSPGDLRIIGLADGAEAIPEGEGAICRITLRVVNSIAYIGNNIPVYFQNVLSADNTLSQPGGTSIERADIDYKQGSILIQAPEAQLLGDINLNAIPYEIADAVYMTNFYISPSKYPLDPVQILNSDINRDGIAPSIADLVELIKVISGAINPPAKLNISTAVTSVNASLFSDITGTYLQVDAPVDIAGLYVSLSGADLNKVSPVNLTDMDLSFGQDNDRFNCVLISFDNLVINAGVQSLVKISSSPNLNVEVMEAEAADIYGRVINIYFKEGTSLPIQFDLHQNHPNPFNPTTDISFDLQSESFVMLAVYNVLGQEVKRLVDEKLEAGQHKVTWDATDNNGQRVASGVYMYRIVAGDFRATRKMVLLK